MCDCVVCVYGMRTKVECDWYVRMAVCLGCMCVRERCGVYMAVYGVGEQKWALTNRSRHSLGPAVGLGGL